VIFIGKFLLLQGADQPFYHVAVDARDWRGADLPDSQQAHMPVCYAAEEQLDCPAFHGSTWAHDYSESDHADFVHPYEYVLFLGKDNHGDYIPAPELRTAYGAARKDVHPVDDDDSGGSGEGGSADVSDGGTSDF
jgi:hypothetical protein